MQIRSRFKKKKILWFALGAILACLILPPVVVPAFVPWSEINCRHDDINIKTGQGRYSRYIWFVKVSEKVIETSLSATIEGQVIDVSDVEPWHRVNTFSPGLRHSPHYAFHGAISQTKKMDLICDLIHAGPEERREIAENILRLWQTEKHYHPVDEYLQSLVEEQTKEPL